MSFECVNCGELSTDMVATNDGMICGDCYENDYHHCDECSGIHHADNMRWFDDRLLCEDCYSEIVGYCEDCECEVYRDDLTNVGNSVYHWVCDDCVDSHICERCENTFETLYDGMCEYCYNECNNYDDDDDVDNIIESYSYKPYPKFFGEGPRFFGVELETEPLHDGDGDVDMVREVQELVAEWGYLKHDGSLNHGGFELVTHPMTLEHHLQKFTPELFSTIKSSGYVSHTNGNCGLHIHISREAFDSELAIVKLLEFIYGNYEEVVKKLGRRNDMTSYCKNGWDITYKKMDSILSYNSRDRYNAVNTRNAHTVELRFFRGTLVRDTFVSALQFADVLVNLSNNITNISQKIEWSDVFLEVARLGYNELSHNMAKRLDIDTLITKKYEGYEIEVEEEEEEEDEEEDKEEQTTSHLSPDGGIIWSNHDEEVYPPEVLEVFSSNYNNRIGMDYGTLPRVPIGTFVQVMPVTMMRLMRHYGRTYPRDMREFAGMIYRVSDIIGDRHYRLDISNCSHYYSWDRSSFRVLSEQEVSDMGLV